MSEITRLARPEIRDLNPYRAAHYEDGLVRLNANETPWPPPGDHSATGVNQYPEIRPLTLTRRLADLYSVDASQLLVTRGSSEAIDLLVRCFCRPGADDIVICPPTFGMYAMYAQVQGAGIVEVPLRAEDGFDVDVDAITAAWTDRTKLAFVCSPNNPTGNSFATDSIVALAKALRGRGIVVVDAAYVEFAATDPTRELLEAGDNVVVLRTLSKAFGMAGIRCGAALAAPAVIDMLGSILPPYCYPTPCADVALACLAPENRDDMSARADRIRAERDRVAARLAALPSIEHVWPSASNFLLCRATQPPRLIEAAKRGGFLIRDFSWDRHTPGCVRITIGSAEQNDRLLEALEDRS